MAFNKQSHFKKSFFIFLGLFLFVIMHFRVIGQENRNSGILRLFDSEDILNIRLVCDFKQLLEKREDTTLKLPGKVYVLTDAKVTDSVDCTVSVRGKFRRKSNHCDFPPLKLKFKKSGKETIIFSGIKSAKLVTHCRTANEQSADLVFAENLVYQLWNYCSEYGYRTRLINIDYIFGKQQDTIISSYGFFIEDDADMAKRNSSEIVKDGQPDSLQLDRMSLLKLALFQYMIGNTDYSASMRHNTDIIKISGSKTYIPIPFDFDYNEFVSPPYADIFSRFEKKKSGQIFRSICPTIEEISVIIEHFKSIKKGSYNLVRKDKNLSRKKKAELIKYLKGFQKIIRNKKLVQNEFFINCK